MAHQMDSPMVDRLELRMGWEKALDSQLVWLLELQLVIRKRWERWWGPRKGWGWEQETLLESLSELARSMVLHLDRG